MYEDDEDDERENILKMLGGEVDDFAGSQLKDPNEKKMDGGTVTITIATGGDPKPFEGKETPEEEEMEAKEEGEDGHDPIAHILGMCGGGCAK